MPKRKSFGFLATVRWATHKLGFSLTLSPHINTNSNLISSVLDWLQTKFKISILSHPQSSRHLENTLVKDLSLLHGQSLPALERGPIVKYFPTAGRVFGQFSLSVLNILDVA